MLKYLIVQLDDSAASFCHYPNERKKQKLIPLDILEKAIMWAMKENLNVQFLYPDYELPDEYKDTIDKVDHIDIISSNCKNKTLHETADTVVLDSFRDATNYPFAKSKAYIIRTTLSELIQNANALKEILPSVSRLNIIVTDVEKFNTDAQDSYSIFLESISDQIVHEYEIQHPVQLNILTDRIMLDTMNNCGAGVESITFAPDGKFYICPAFYIDGDDSVGDITNGIEIKNQQLYDINHSPICCTCDAWQCKRCVWLNKNFTYEVNTPGREQCIMAHLEREASRKLLEKIRIVGDFMPEKEIKRLSFLDPFEEILKKQRHEF